MHEVEKVDIGLRGEDCFGNVYVIGLPPQYLSEEATAEDAAIGKEYIKMLREIINDPQGKNSGIILPVVRDEYGQPYFYFNVHHKSKPKYKYRETVKAGDMEHTFEADTIERLNELKLNLRK